MPIARSTLAGAVSGVVLLAGAAGFTIGLPKVSDDPGSYAGSLPRLPDRLDDRMVALSSVKAADLGAATDADRQQVDQIVKAARQGDEEASKGLGRQYGKATVKLYVDSRTMADPQRQTAPAQLSVTVVPGEVGLVTTNGPFQIRQNGQAYQLQTIGGHKCAVSWVEPTDPTTGAPTAGEVPPSNYQLDCRAAKDGLAYDVFATGLSPEEVAGYLDKVLEVDA